MARIGVSYDEVKAAALAILATGEQPSLRSVRDALGRGSNTTISGHMARWRATEQPIPEEVPPPDVSASVASAIQDDKERAIAAARAPLLARIASMEGEAQLVRDESNASEDEIERLQDQVAILTTERDQAQALAGERAEEIRRLTDALVTERTAKDALVLQAATLQLKTDAQSEQLTELKTALATAQSELSTAAKGRQAAETRLAGLEAKEAAERARADELANRVKRIEQRAEELDQRAQQAEQRAQEAEKEAKSAMRDANTQRVAAEAAQARIEAAERDASQARQALADAKADARSAQDEAAELRGRLAAQLATDDEQAGTAAKKPLK